MARECSSGTSPTTSMEHVLLLRSRPIDIEQLKACCKPTYQIRKLRNRGAILVLVWNYLVISLFYYVTTYAASQQWHYIIWGLTLPTAGWIADVYLGRYKVICWSMWIMWAGSILATTSSVYSSTVGGQLQ